MKPEQEKDKTYFTDKEVSDASACILCFFISSRGLFGQTGVELELVESMPLLEWFANNYKTFGATLEIITDRSQEGAQFVKGFGGIGGQ